MFHFQLVDSYECSLYSHVATIHFYMTNECHILFHAILFFNFTDKKSSEHFLKLCLRQTHTTCFNRRQTHANTFHDKQMLPYQNQLSLRKTKSLQSCLLMTMRMKCEAPSPISSMKITTNQLASLATQQSHNSPNTQQHSTTKTHVIN